MSFAVVARPKAPPGHIVLWVNIYHYGVYQTGGCYKTRREADNIVSKKWRFDCVPVIVPLPTKENLRRRK